MSTILENVKSDLKEAIFSKNESAKDALRIILGEVPRLNKKAGEEVTDEDMMNILRKLKKSESDLLEKSGKDSSEYLEIINKYLPPVPTDEDIIAWINENLDLSTFKNVGMVVPRVLSHFNSTVDGKTVMRILKTLKGE